MHKVVLCDTDTLLHNIRGPKSEDDRLALEQLLEMRTAGGIVLLRSEVNRAEVANTKNEEMRAKLEADYEALQPVAKEENILVANTCPTLVRGLLRAVLCPI